MALERLKATLSNSNKLGINRVEGTGQSGESERQRHLLKENPERQQVVQRLLKGIVPIADIVQIGSSYYSLEPTEDELEDTVEIESEIASDIALLRFIFRDTDHRLRYSDHKYINVAKLNERKYYLFDLGKIDFWSRESLLAKGRARRFLQTCPEGTSKILFSKCNRLIELLESPSGQDLVHGIIQASGQEIQQLFALHKVKDYDAELFANEIIARCKKTLVLLENGNGNI